MTEDFYFTEFVDGSNHKHHNNLAKIAIAKENIVQGLRFEDEVLSDEWCDRAYNFATTIASEENPSKAIKSWGAYVSTADVLSLDISTEDIWTLAQSSQINSTELIERAIALEAARALFSKLGCGVRTLTGSEFDLASSHGIAVWCLSSCEGDSVDYHIDYAELFRYETGIILPPLAAGTIQLTSKELQTPLLGGEFMANSHGIEHYKKFGYKGQLSGPLALQEEISSGSGWSTIRFQRGRGILHCGLWPHLSLPVRQLGPGQRRVVLGLNLFPVFDPLNECCVRAPEHSRAFNRTVRLYQALNGGLGLVGQSHYSRSNNSSNSANIKQEESVSEAGMQQQKDGNKIVSGEERVSKITPSLLLQNKPLARLIILTAKRLREKEREQQNYIDEKRFENSKEKL